MRILGFSIDWAKLKQDKFTTFRFERRDRDWGIGEVVQVKLKPRSKGGGILLGNAVIKSKDNRDGDHFITEQEAQEDGFGSKSDMWKWLLKAHSPEQLVRPLNKLTLEWVK